MIYALVFCSLYFQCIMLHYHIGNSKAFYLQISFLLFIAVKDARCVRWGLLGLIELIPMWLSVRKGIQFVISTLPQLVPRAKSPRPTLAFAGSMSFRLPPNFCSSPQTNFWYSILSSHWLEGFNFDWFRATWGPLWTSCDVKRKTNNKKQR